MKITRPTHTSHGGVGDLTTAAKTNIKLVDSRINNTNNILHDEGINKFVRSHIKE